MSETKPDRCPTCKAVEPQVMAIRDCPDAFHVPKPETQAERLRWEAHDACPYCRGAFTHICRGYKRGDDQKGWSGHAAIDALADALAEKDLAYTEIHHHMRNLTASLENRNRENASLLKRAETAEVSFHAWQIEASKVGKVLAGVVLERDEALKRAEAAERRKCPECGGTGCQVSG